MKSIALQLASLFIALASSAGMAIAATIDPTFAPNIAGLGSIVAAAEAGDGSILLAGVFDSIGNTPLNGLARIGSDGSADPNFAPQLLPVGSSVLTNGITRLSDGRILINGNFKSFGTTTANYAVILNPDGSVSQTFPYSRTDTYVIRYFGLSSGKFMVIDEAGPSNSSPVVGFARLNADGSVDGGFASAEQGIYRVLDLLDGSIVTAEQYINTVRKLTAAGGRDSSFATSMYNGVVNSLVRQPDGKILVAGAFSGGIVRLNADGSPDAAFAMARGSGTTGPYNTSDMVQAILLEADGHIWVGGNFSTFSGAVAWGLIRLASDGTPDPLDYHATGNVVVLTPSAGGTLVAGVFRSVLGVRCWSAVRLQPNQTLDPDFHPLVTNHRAADVTSFGRQPDDKLIVAGPIEAVDGVPTAPLVRLLPDGTLDPTFHAAVGLEDFWLLSKLVVQADGAILLVGNFTTLDGISRPNLARLLPDGQVDSSFDAGVVGSVNSVSVNADGSMFVATAGATFNGVARTGVTLLTANGSLDSSFDPGDTFSPVSGSSVLTVSGAQFTPDHSRIYVFGYFYVQLAPPPPGDSVPVLTTHVAALRPDGSLDRTFQVLLGTSPPNDILPKPDGGLFEVGDYSSYDSDGPYQLCISSIRPSGSFNPQFAVANGFRGTVSRILPQPGGQLLLAGQFRTHTQGPVVSVARLNFDGTEDTSFPFFFGSSPDRDMVITANGSVITQSDFHNSLTRILPDQGNPVVLANPKDIRRLPGANLQLDVSANGAPNLQVQWFRNNSPVSNGQGASLLLTNLSAAKTGAYKAVVTNANGSTESAIATVSLNTPPTFGSIPDQTYPMFPPEIDFTVPVSDAESTSTSLSLQVQWQLPPSAQFNGSPMLYHNPDGSFFLTIPAMFVSPSDSWVSATITLTGFDSDDGVTSTSFRVFNRDPHYAEWASQFFSPADLANPAIGGSDADPNHNGISNLMEYARGANPSAPDSSRDPVLEISGPSGSQTLTLTYYDTIRPDDVHQQVEVSDDLMTWDATGVQWSLIQAQPMPDGRTQRITLQLNAPLDAGVPHKFFRFRATSSQ